MNGLSLANPLGLAGLLSLPVIILLHAMRARSKQVVVPSLQMWSFLEKEVRGNRLRRVPLTWILVLHLLIATLLSLALARPTMDAPTFYHETRQVILLVDVSTSMSATDVLPSRWGQAQAEAARLLGALQEGDVGTVIAFGTTAWPAGDTRTLEGTWDTGEIVEAWQSANFTLPGGGAAGVMKNLLSLLPAQTVADEFTAKEALLTALALAQAAMVPGMPVEVHILTDGAFNDPGRIAFRAPVTWHLFGKQDRSENLAVLELAAHALSPTRTQVFARLANFSSQSQAPSLSLLANGAPILSDRVTLEPRSSLPFTWDVDGVPRTVGIAIVGTDDLPADNKANAGLRSLQPIKVAVAAEDPQPILKALDAIQQVTQNMTVVEYRPGNIYDLVIARGEVPNPADGRAILVLEPAAIQGLDLGPAQVFRTISSPYARDLPALAGVDFTGIRRLTVPALPALPERYQVVLEMQGILSGTATTTAERQHIPLALRDQDNPHVLLFLPGLGDAENIEPVLHHPGFPVLLANLVAEAGALEYPAALKLGEPLPLWPKEQYPRVQIVRQEGTEVELGLERDSTWRGTNEPGELRVTFVDEDGGETTFSLGVNAGSTLESDLEARAWAVEAANQLPAQAGQQDLVAQQLDLTPYFLMAVLLLLFWEAWLAWR